MNPIKLPRERKEHIMEQVKQYFAEERSEELGDIGAEQLIDFMIKELGPLLYNQAVQDARKLLLERMAALEDDLYALERPVQGHR
ncbi:DUF2164 domain-containing protein [Paenibacillus thiaminolyticus]|uniref:DUF2164 domain-containing protein n=1 Tax=Paenibacillus thiaminolyticus TaxID=49283 RepID=UPI001162B812|nr:DUF2164 domain-containing protein [Paenibacillus thiaminolyticus]NGP57223.1 DUF2164 family protein [Paenibacillus thiaminolyticus]WCR27590.1 DUF2164 domain-containing protein [Paenibacillus thiaminolyticus]